MYGKASCLSHHTNLQWYWKGYSICYSHFIIIISSHYTHLIYNWMEFRGIFTSSIYLCFACLCWCLMSLCLSIGWILFLFILFIMWCVILVCFAIVLISWFLYVGMALVEEKKTKQKKKRIRRRMRSCMYRWNKNMRITQEEKNLFAWSFIVHKA